MTTGGGSNGYSGEVWFRHRLFGVEAVASVRASRGSDEAKTQLLTIGGVSERTGCSVKHLHYYERRRLVHVPKRV